MIFRAVVVAVLPAGPVVTISRRGPGGPVGPMPSCVAVLAPGDRVLVADDVDGLADSFAVLGLLA